MKGIHNSSVGIKVYFFSRKYHKRNSYFFNRKYYKGETAAIEKFIGRSESEIRHGRDTRKSS